MEREVGCHSKCDRYKKYARRNAEVLEKKRGENKSEYAYIEGLVRRKERRRRRHHEK